MSVLRRSSFAYLFSVRKIKIFLEDYSFPINFMLATMNSIAISDNQASKAGSKKKVIEHFQ